MCCDELMDFFWWLIHGRGKKGGLKVTLNLGSHAVYPTDALDSLKQFLTVKSGKTVVTDYTLSGRIDSVGEHEITVNAGGETAAFTVTVVGNPDGILYEWDFTKGLTDLRQGQTAALGTGEAQDVPDKGKTEGTTPPSQGDTGIVFYDAQQFVRLLPIGYGVSNLYNKTIEIDVAEFEFALPDPAPSYMRFLTFCNPSNNNGDNLFDTGIAYIYSAADAPANYRMSWRLLYKHNKTKGYDVGKLLSGDINSISGKTVGIYLNAAGRAQMWLDGSTTGVQASFPIQSYLSSLQIGQGAKPQNGGCFNNGRITGVRIYQGNKYA